jgi:hypothetical protein
MAKLATVSPPCTASGQLNQKEEVFVEFSMWIFYTQIIFGDEICSINDS